MKKLRFVGAFGLIAAILLFPQVCVRSAQRSMQIWYGSVLPSLFPFLVLMPLLTNPDACILYDRLFGRCMQPLFHLPGSAAPAVVISMICGSPGGSIALARIASASDLNSADVKRIAYATGGVSPAYLITGVGAVLLGSAKTGYILAGIQAAVQIILLFIYGRTVQAEDAALPPSELPPEEAPIHAALFTVLGVAGYMLVFSVIAGVIAHIAGEGLQTALLSILDLPSGAAAISNLDFSLKLPVISALIGFGGLCIIMQNMDHLNRLGIGRMEYMLTRCISALLSMGIALCVFGQKLEGAALKALSNREIYTFSMLIVLLIAIPATIILSKKLFLNKNKGEI